MRGQTEAAVELSPGAYYDVGGEGATPVPHATSDFGHRLPFLAAHFGNRRRLTTPGPTRPDTRPDRFETNDGKPLTGQPVIDGPSPGQTTSGAGDIVGGTDRPDRVSEHHKFDNLSKLQQSADGYPFRAMLSLLTNFPTMQVQPGTVKGRAVFCADNAAHDLPLADATVAVRFKSESGADFYVAFDGTAERPTAANAGQNTATNYAASVLNPQGWYFVKDKAVISVLAVNPGTIVTAECIVNSGP